ncbi:MAG: hypothetical protein LBT80_08805 [Lactobacillaceae bacterium]|jgi:hypothetical protein|nr:hypothetical protein [Lactobacillaceae bacterium]
MKKSQRLAKKIASRLTKDVELQLKRGLIHVELVDAPADIEAYLNQEN